MLTAADAPAVAAAFGLAGRVITLSGPVARGQLGQVWRLEVDGTPWAVKAWFAPPDVAGIESHAHFSESARLAGVFTPATRRSRAGFVVATVGGQPVRVSEWVDLEERNRALDPAEVGRAVALLHQAGQPSDLAVDDWFATGLGSRSWLTLHARLEAARAPFAGELDALLAELLAVEELIEPHERPRMCHRDLWADNVLASADGRVCVIDFDNAGPADPSQELALVLFEFGLDDPGRSSGLYRAYVHAGGPGRVTRPGQFTMLVAEQAHIAGLACERWLEAHDPAERDRLEAWFKEIPDDPVTCARIGRILHALG